MSKTLQTKPAKKKSQTMDPASIDWEFNETKRFSDQTVYRAMAFDIHQMRRRRSYRKPVRVLSFPGSSWAWETGLNEMFDKHRFLFTGLERNPEVHAQAGNMCATLKANRLLDEDCRMAELGSFEDFRSTNERDKFDVIYLDWMGTWSREKKNDIDALLGNGCALNDGGLLLITLSLRRGRPETMAELADHSYALPMTFYDARGEDKYVSNLKVRGVPHWIVEQAYDRFGVRLRPIMAHIYYSQCGKGQTQPQLQLMFLREEGGPSK